ARRREKGVQVFVPAHVTRPAAFAISASSSRAPVRAVSSASGLVWLDRKLRGRCLGSCSLGRRRSGAGRRVGVVVPGTLAAILRSVVGSHVRNEQYALLMAQVRSWLRLTVSVASRISKLEHLALRCGGL